MKNITINLAALWGAAIRSFVDGDIFREANIDLSMGDVADRLGYLKNAVDGKASLAGNNSWTGTNTFATSAGPVTVTNDGDDFVCQAPIQIQGGLNCTSPAEFDDEVILQGGVVLPPADLADANATIDATKVHNRVPVLTNSRVYTLPATAGLTDGHTIFVEKVTTAATHTATIQDPSGPATLAVLDAGAAGWASFIKRGSAWRLGPWGGAVSSLATTP